MKKSMLRVTVFALGIMLIGVFMYKLLSNNITAQIPAASSYVPSFKDWTVHFSEEMNPDTFSNETVKVINDKNEPVSISFEWNNDNTILTLKSPDTGYEINEKYSITISDTVQTAEGENLSKSYTHAFQTVNEVPRIKDEEQLLTLINERMKSRKFLYGDVVMAAEDGAEAKSDNTSDMSGNSSTSKTNVQVEGIDEGDKVKTDGEYIYFSRDNDVLIASTDGSNSKVISTIQEKDYYTQELFLHEDLLVTIGYTHIPIRQPIDPDDTSSKKMASFYPYSMLTTVYFYDISDKENPKQIREFTMEGSLTASRKMDGFLYLVGNNHPPYHYFMEDANVDDLEVRPFVKDSAVGNEGEPVDFEDMYFFPESDDESFMLLTSIDLNDMEKEASVETYLGASNQIYMSKNHLYTAVRKYNIPEKTSTDAEPAMDIMFAHPADTEIIQFKIDKGSLTYNASTVVNGTLINQFAMDERNNTFRVATTKGEVWRDDNPSTNNLYTFDMNLKPLGKVEGLAEGERIYSVRFMENVAYMVTFKQVDPLFVIDLGDAKNPKVLGELKIPGFSNYLHPLDENHVIGFGQHTELVPVEGSDEPRVRQRGLKISVFDVSDPANPKEKFTEILGTSGHSELNYNHKALFQHPEKNLFGFPAQLFETKMVQKDDIVYEDYSFLFEGAFLYEISPETGITLKDSITHQNEGIKYPDWEKQIQRMVSVDDMLYTLSFDQIKVYDMENESVVKTVKLPAIMSKATLYK